MPDRFLSPLPRRAVLFGVSLLTVAVTGATLPRESGSAEAANADGDVKSSRLVRRESARRVAVDARGRLEHTAVAEAASKNAPVTAVAPSLPAAGAELPLGEPASFAAYEANASQTAGELPGPGPHAEGAEAAAPAATDPRAAELLEAHERGPDSDDGPGAHEAGESGTGASNAGANTSEPDPGPFYLKKAQRRCGACGAANDLHIGYANGTSDTVDGGEVLDLCGAACSRHNSCGGFDYLRTIGRCYYRKSTACEESEDLDRDCYVKVPSALVKTTGDW